MSQKAAKNSGGDDPSALIAAAKPTDHTAGLVMPQPPVLPPTSRPVEPADERGFFTPLPSSRSPWNMESLASAPRVDPDPQLSVEGVQAIFYEGLPWKGRPTRIFAYYGLPSVQPGEQVPAMVLVHGGGGGAAFIPWVKLWMSRGYAAIAMDTCGCISGGGYETHPRHADGGPAGWGGFDQIDEPVEDQWTFHAVAAVVRTPEQPERKTAETRTYRRIPGHRHLIATVLNLPPIMRVPPIS